jgi:exosortase
LATYFDNVGRWDWFALIIPLLALSQLLYPEAKFLWGKDHMQFFPLAIIAAAWFLFQEGKPGYLLSKNRARFAVALSVVGIFISYIALFFFSSWLAHVAMIVLTFSWALGKFANLTVLRLIGVCGLLAVTLPPPFNWDREVVRGLQSLSTIVSSNLMDITQIKFIRNGNVIELHEKSLFVEEACSGVDSQYALMAVAGTLLLVGRAGLWVSIITIVTVPIWAILGNLLRIYSIALGIEWFGIDLSAGKVHTILGLVTFSLAAWAHWSSVQFLNFSECYFAVDSPVNINRNEDQASFNTLSHGGIELVSKAALIFPVLMAFLTPMVFVSTVTQEYRLPRITPEIEALLPREKDLPKIVNRSMRTYFNKEDRDSSSALGMHSRIWHYSDDNIDHIASLDFPFRGWHALWGCYQSNGWTVLTTEEIITEANISYFETHMQNAEGKRALLMFSLFDANGDPFIYKRDSLVSAFQNRFDQSAFRRFFEVVNGETNPITFQFQLFTSNATPLDKDQQQACRDLFIVLRDVAKAKSLAGFRKLVAE